MKKKGLKPSLNISSSEDMKFANLSKKEQGKAIGGNPDETDFKNITIWVDMFEKAYPGVIAKMAQDAYVEQALSEARRHAEVNKGSEMVKLFWLPAPIQEIFERAYPSLWTNKKHAQWFANKFPVFSYDKAWKRTTKTK